MNATAGFSVDGAGDVDRDGVPDQIVGALGQGSTASVTGPGAAFVVYGQRTKTPAKIDLAHLATAQGYAIIGATAGDEAGTWVANAGDVDGDLQPDQLVVAPAANPISAAAARARSAGSRFTTGYAYTVLAPNPPPPPRPVATAIPGRAAVDGARRARVVVTCLTSAPCRGRLALYRGGRAVSSAVRFSIAGGRAHRRAAGARDRDARAAPAPRPARRPRAGRDRATGPGRAARPRARARRRRLHRLSFSGG